MLTRLVGGSGGLFLLPRFRVSVVVVVGGVGVEGLRCLLARGVSCAMSWDRGSR